MTHLKNNDDMVYWLFLNERPWLLPVGVIIKAYEELGSLASLWESPDSYLNNLGVSEKGVASFRKYGSSIRFADLRKQIESCNEKGIDIIRIVDKEYPEQLKKITGTPEGPPLVIFRDGVVKEYRNCVAIVGTRNCSFYGKDMAMQIAKGLASKGYIIVSGLARGTDEWVHFGALKAKGGKTIAILPWMDPVYPPEHRELLEDIKRRGAVLTERYSQTFWKGARGKFVERNRIISGISLCVVAIESDREGGTVHQVDFAMRQGIKVFALIPKDNERARRGYELFLEKGATPIKSAAEVLKYINSKKRPIKESRIESFYPNPQKTLEESGENGGDSL